MCPLDVNHPVERIYSENLGKRPGAFVKGYLEHLIGLLNRLDVASVEDFILRMEESRQMGKKILFIGNGGSAATASHFANDIAIGTRSPEKPFKALSLTDNVAVLTAVANDDGYEEVFLKQLEVLLEPGDIVVAISASGNSKNLVTAIEYANARGNHTIGLTGFDGGLLRKLCKSGIHVDTHKGEYGPVEDIQMILDHITGNYLSCLVKASE